jgi:hypothetical protein
MGGPPVLMGLPTQVPPRREGMMTRPAWTDAQLAAYNARLAGAYAGRLTVVANKPKGTMVGRSPRRKSMPMIREADVLRAVLACLEAHPKVAFCWRSNTGGFSVGPETRQRYVKAGFVGQSDILGMLTDGRFLAVEVKRPGAELSNDQAAFLANVTEFYGVGFVARSVDDVLVNLGELPKASA